MCAVLKDPLLCLRPMTDTDLRSVMAVERAAYEYPWSLGILCDCLQVGYCCWVWQLDRRILGHGVMSVAAGECHLLNICIHPDWQGQGLGRCMLTRLLTVGRRHQADTAFLEVRVSNVVALRLYRGEGFNEVGVRRGYYPHRSGREDALVLAKDLR
jgi:ribosomal-protein-alanine N-acetyltransferase